MIAVAPLLVWAWLTGENSLKAERQAEQQNIHPSKSIEKLSVKTIKPSMSRERAFQILLENGFQPQMPAKKFPSKSSLEVQVSKNGISKVIKLTDKFNKPILLHFWATWCGPCKKEMPHFAQFVSKQDTFDVYVITPELRNAHPEEFVNIWNFYEKHHLSGINVCAESNGILSEFLGVSGIPVTFIVAADGTLLGRFLGMTDWNNKEFADAVISYVASAPSSK